MTTLSVVIPAYNEEKGIAEIVDRVMNIQGNLAKVGVDHMELLVVDDGSRDKTAEIILGIANNMVSKRPELRLIRHPKNKGYGAALKTGFSQAKGN